MKNNIIKHYRTANADVSPNSNDLEYGEIAIKYVKDNETIFIKNNENEIAEFKDKKYVDKKIEGVETIIENNELVIAKTFNKFIKSTGFDENCNSTLDNGMSLTNAIKDMQKEWGHQGPQGPKGMDLTSGNYLPLSGGTMDNQNVVTNLNADLLDGYDGSAYSKTGHSHDELYYTESEIDLKLEEIETIIEDDELITATAINKIFKSSGFDENGDSTLQGGVSLTSAIENLQNEWGHQGPQGVMRDVNEVDHSGNREIAGAFDDEARAQEYADAKNRLEEDE